VANEKGLNFFVLKIDGGSSSCILDGDCDTWHNTNVLCGILNFGQNKY
jgi:hypothetical protein